MSAVWLELQVNYKTENLENFHGAMGTCLNCPEAAAEHDLAP
jgi:hypothetical protein